MKSDASRAEKDLLRRDRRRDVSLCPDSLYIYRLTVGEGMHEPWGVRFDKLPNLSTGTAGQPIWRDQGDAILAEMVCSYNLVSNSASLLIG